MKTTTSEPNPRPGRSPEAESSKETALCRVPVFHPVALKLLQVLAMEDVSVSEITRLLNTDPGFSVEVLTMANSAAYSTCQRIGTVQRAVTMLGIERTRAMATHAALGSMLRGLGRNPALENCWSHSRATALVAQGLAPFYNIHPERAYTVGLMHDVGRLGLLAVEPQQYAKLLLNLTGPHDELLEAERMAFRMNHCEAGQHLTRTWNLPQEFQDAASQHHDRHEAGSIGDLLRLSCAMAQALGYKAAPFVEGDPFEALLEQVPGASGTRSDSLVVLADRLQHEIGAPLEPAASAAGR